MPFNRCARCLQAKENDGLVLCRDCAIATEGPDFNLPGAD